MKKNLQLLCVFAFAITTCTAQETAQPVADKSNRIILHFDDTSGIFIQLGKLLVDRGFEIEIKDRELGVIRTRPTIYYSTRNYHPEIKTIFRDSTVTIYAHIGFKEYSYEVRYTPKKGLLYGTSYKAWVEMMNIAEMLKPRSITYAQLERSLL